MDFKQELKTYQNIINQELQKYTIKENSLEKTLYDSMEYSLMAGGKRLRPILVLATYILLTTNKKSIQDIEKNEYTKCLPYATAIEMIHNFSLIHDDLPGIDNDDIRHGKPTNHKKFNEATAILAGDALLNKSYTIISEDLQKTKDPEEIKIKTQILNELSNAVSRMIAGEYIDTEYEGKKINIQDLEYIHKNKTGALLTISVRMGALLAKVDQQTLENLTKYSQKIGLAFQVKDDILSEEGNEKELGKPVGNDKEKQKCTYVSQYGLNGAKDILNTLTEDAINCLSNYGENAEFLIELAKYIKERNK